MSNHVLDDKTDKLYTNKYGRIMGMYGTSAKEKFVLTPFGSRCHNLRNGVLAEAAKREAGNHWPLNG